MSLRFSLFANSIRSWTDKYFCFSKHSSNACSCLSVKIVRALRDFLLSDCVPVEDDLIPFLSTHKSGVEASAEIKLTVTFLYFEHTVQEKSKKI